MAAIENLADASLRGLTTAVKSMSSVLRMALNQPDQAVHPAAVDHVIHDTFNDMGVQGENLTLDVRIELMETMIEERTRILNLLLEQMTQPTTANQAQTVMPPTFVQQNFVGPVPQNPQTFLVNHVHMQPQIPAAAAAPMRNPAPPTLLPAPPTATGNNNNQMQMREY